MALPKLEDINSERFLDAAFDAKQNARLIHHARVRRNIYLWFFLTGVACVFITAFTGQTLLCVLSLFLGTLSLVVMTKYDTRLFFLRVLRQRGEELEEIDHSAFEG